MAQFNDRSVERIRRSVEQTERDSGRGPEGRASIASSTAVTSMLGIVRSGPDGDGKYTGRIAYYDVGSDDWAMTDVDVKFLPSNGESLTLDRRYLCRPSHVDDDGYTVYDVTLGGGQAYVHITEPWQSGTGTDPDESYNEQGRSVGRLTTYSVDNDGWFLTDTFVLVEPLNDGQFVTGTRYPCWYAGEATGGFDGTGTGVGTGTGTGTAGGTTPVYIADPSSGHSTATLEVVIPPITMSCVDNAPRAEYSTRFIKGHFTVHTTYPG